MPLYVVATPIGNLEDISYRALRILKEVDLILCEDTRQTKKLLNHFQINTLTLSYHQHSRLKKINYILSLLKQNKDLALVTDAGTPGISDPGNQLISLAVKQLSGLTVIPVPGPCALTAALSVSGFPADKFVFLGFLPRKKKRKKSLAKIINSQETIVFYESPYRIIKTLSELNDFFQFFAKGGLPSGSKGREIMVGRELTKKFETIYRGKIEEVIKKLKKGSIKGEFVVVVSPNTGQD